MRPLPLPGPFAFRTARQILFGSGESRRAAEIAGGLGRRVLLVTGARSLERSGRLSAISAALTDRGVAVVHWVVPTEPDIALVDAGAAASREEGCDAVVAVGGGSVIDAGKAVAALATNPGPALDYLEEVGAGRVLERVPLPVVAVPTTAGSGSETTRNSVLLVPEASVKRSLRSDLLLPAAAIVDPELSATAPPAVAAAAGLDALTHLIESYTSTRAHAMSDALALPGIRLAAAGLQALAAAAAPNRADRQEGGKQAAASAPAAGERALASLWGGITLANAGLGAVHGLAAPLGGTARVAHGVACACLLPHTLVVNVEALRRRQPASPALARYQDVLGIVSPHDPTPEGTAATLEDLRRRLGVPSLGTVGLHRAELETVVEGSRGGSMRSNPIDLTDAELTTILDAALDADSDAKISAGHGELS